MMLYDVYRSHSSVSISAKQQKNAIPSVYRKIETLFLFAASVAYKKEGITKNLVF